MGAAELRQLGESAKPSTVTLHVQSVTVWRGQGAVWRERDSKGSKGSASRCPTQELLVAGSAGAHPVEKGERALAMTGRRGIAPLKAVEQEQRCLSTAAHRGLPSIGADMRRFG